MGSVKVTYGSVVQGINQVVQRQAMSIKKLQAMIKKSKVVRKNNGQLGLLAYGKQFLYNTFSQKEIDYLKRTNQYKPIIMKVVSLMVAEKVISPMEAGMVKNYL